MSLEDRQRLLKEREKPVKEWIDKTNSYIADIRDGRIPSHSPEDLKRGLKKSGDDLFNALIKGAFGPYESTGSLHAGYIVNKANEASFQLCCETGEIPDDEKLEQRNLDSLLPPPNWKEQHCYTFGDKVLKNGRIQMCVKEHNGNEEFLDNPRYWRDVVAKIKDSDKERKRDLRIPKSDSEQNRDGGGEWYFEVGLPGVFKVGYKKRGLYT